MEILFNALIVDMSNYVQKAQADKDNGLDNSNTVFGALLESELPPAEKSLQRMTDEGFSLFAGGTETVSWALTVITYHLLNQPALLSKLTAEVHQAIYDSDVDSTGPGEVPSWAALEKRPYLRAVIHEGLRLSYGLASRTSRVATGEDLLYQGEWIPKGSAALKKVEYMIARGYAVGMSSVITHHDESIFPDSHSFVPERWLDEGGQHRKQLDRSLLAFSKGSRSCIGINHPKDPPTKAHPHPIDWHLTSNGYILSRSRSHASASRLNLQYHLWQRSLGYKIYPSIALPPTPCIADIASGTAL
ncbi:MAG: hypothetical protein Q9170_002059 [Blastenia crenularia]